MQFFVSLCLHGGYFQFISSLFFVVILLFTDNNNHFSWCSSPYRMIWAIPWGTTPTCLRPRLSSPSWTCRPVPNTLKTWGNHTCCGRTVVSDFLAEKLKPEPIWSPWTPCTLLPPEPPSGPWPPGVLSLLFLSDGSNRSVLCIDILLLIRAPPSRSGRLLLWCLAFTTALMVKCRF